MSTMRKRVGTAMLVVIATILLAIIAIGYDADAGEIGGNPIPRASSINTSFVGLQPPQTRLQVWGEYFYFLSS